METYASCKTLLSVYDKTDLIDFAKGLGVRLLGSGGTAKKIRDAGSASPRFIPSDDQDLKAQFIYPFSIVAISTFSKISKPDCTLADTAEEIDIGGVTLRAAA